MNDTEQRITVLEQRLELLLEGQTINEAMVRAIYTVVEELAQEAGIEEAHFLKHFEDRFHFWHDHYTRVGKSGSQEAARHSAVISYTRLFGPTTEE